MNYQRSGVWGYMLHNKKSFINVYYPTKNKTFLGNQSLIRLINLYNSKRLFSRNKKIKKKQFKLGKKRHSTPWIVCMMALSDCCSGHQGHLACRPATLAATHRNLNSSAMSLGFKICFLTSKIVQRLCSHKQSPPSQLLVIPNICQ